MKSRFGEAWRGPGGVGEVLGIAYPLILSHLSFTLQTFVDRLLLTWYSTDAVAGAVAGLFAVWALISLFTGTGEYLTTFIAQYAGARRQERIGAAVWQGIYFAAGAGALCALAAPLAGPFFAWSGHDPAVREYEVAYASTLLAGGLPVVLMATLSSFFAGRGATLVVLKVNVLVTLVNVVLSYLWIFGYAGFPRAGVVGAARATILSHAVGALAYLALVLAPSARSQYGTLSGWRFEAPLFRRLIRFGLPSGLQYSIEILAFALFLGVVGRLGSVELAATGIAFNLNGLVFVPMMGLGLGVSALVARHLGAGDPAHAERSTWSGLGIAFVYMGLWSSLYLLVPGGLLAPYAAGAHDASFPAVERLAIVLLRFVALYSIFDMVNLICASGLRGAGDTAYTMRATLVLAWAGMLLPTWLACTYLGAGIYVAWTAASGYVVVLGLFMLRRFRAGAWKALRVIEAAPAGA
jgi:multidrug resistance protein, MATE family